MRLFFALEPDRQSAINIADWRDRQLPGAGRAVPTANLHITLAFLGEISHHRLEGLCTAVDDYLQRRPADSGELHLDQVGYWPKPGILWLGPHNWPDMLNQLAAGLAQLGTAEGSRRKRGAFQPHITLFRGCDRAPSAPASPPSFTLPYRDFALLESRQGRHGVSYHPLAHWALA
jgi:RNA 2',3'-cyclic 3'-phosphodiesterase